MKKALMIGSTVADIMIYVDHLPSVEEDVEPTGQTMSIGGCCFNVSNMLSFFKVPYTLFSPVGSGIYGTFILEELKKRGIEPFLTRSDANGCCYCIVDKNGNRSFLALHGAEYLFEKEWFEALDSSEYSDVYVCGLEIEDKTGDVIVDFIKRNPQLNVYFAPSARLLHIPENLMEELLDCSPILHLNREEACMYLRSRGELQEAEPEVPQLCRQLYERTKNIVFVTDGANGAYAFDGEQEYGVPAFPATARDGTGAGDSHIGTLMALRMLGYPLQTAMRIAAFASARVVSQSGGILND
ncbi:MAG: ribokinase [Solobacterium sp.]|nr:ribokinase [Solobacterium sp.]